MTTQSGDAENTDPPSVRRSLTISTEAVLQKTKRRCLIINTGGTFGMAARADGVLEPRLGHLADFIEGMVEFQHPTMPHIDIDEWEQPIDSSDFVPSDWSRLARTIEEHYFDYDGFIIIHGTDTMAYTASALSFMLENLAKPVILCGAMMPLYLPCSDARRNLVMSALCASTLEIPEVCIYNDDKLLRGNRSTKVHSMSTAAFYSNNCRPLASCQSGDVLIDRIVLPAPRRQFRVHTDLHTEIIALHLVPGFSNGALETLLRHWRAARTTTEDPNKASSAYRMTRSETMRPRSVSDDALQPIAPEIAPENPRAVILSLYGTGNGSNRREGLLSFVEEASKQGIAVAVVSQCSAGRVELARYENGEELMRRGAISGGDMTMEACATKLAFLIGKGKHGEALRRAMETDLRGELTPQIEFESHSAAGIYEDVVSWR